MNFKNLLLIVLTLTAFSCEQKTKLMKKKKENKEIELNYSPLVDDFSRLFQFRLEDSVQKRVVDDEIDELEKIIYTINKGNVEGYDELEVLSEDEDYLFKNTQIRDLIKNPEDFRSPVLGDFCSDKKAEYVAHKYSFVFEGYDMDIYAFSVIGKCDNVDTRCAAIYLTSDEIIPAGYPEEEIFQKPFFELVVMGIDGKDQNCNAISSKAFPIIGCMDESANNYSSVANRPGYCDYNVYGCTDPTANNHDQNATIDDNSCTYDPLPIPTCNDQSANNFGQPLPCTCTFGPYDQVNGCSAPPAPPVLTCNDPSAINQGDPLPCQFCGPGTIHNGIGGCIPDTLPCDPSFDPFCAP